MIRTSLYIILLIAVSPVYAQDQASQTPGLPWVFFNSTDFTRPDSENGTDGQIKVDTGANFNDYSKFWTGYLKAPTTGEITITAEVDNGLRLAVGGKLVINGWDADGAREAKVTVKEGELLPFQLEYFQDGGEAFCRLYWQWEGHEKELIPAGAFFHDQKDKDLIDKLKSGEVQVPDARSWKP